MKELQEAIEQTASKSLNQTNEQIAGVIKSAAQLGVEGVESLKEFGVTVGQLSNVTGMSVQQITSGMGQILTATGEVKDGQGVGDASPVADKTQRDEGLMQAAERLTMMTAGMKLS